MTPNKVIEIVDGIKPNSYDEEMKLRWINELDGTVQKLVMQEGKGECREWEEHFADNKWNYSCRFCGYGFEAEEKVGALPNYCQSCGVKMDGGTDIMQYSYPDDMDKELLIPAPFDSLYSLYLQAMIDYQNKEYGNYNNSASMFETRFSDYKKAYIRENRAKG